MEQTIRIADKPTADEIKSTVESNAEKLDGIVQELESGGMLADPNLGLAALKQSLDELKNYVGNGKRDVANAITGKGISTATDAGFATLVKNIESIITLMQGTQDANATASQILKGYSAYVKGTKVNGGINSLGAQTITPGTSNKTIAAGQYLSGQQTIAGDANLTAANIKKGVSIFGVNGNADGDLTFKKNDVSSVGGNYSSQYNLRLVGFTPYIFKYSVSTPVGSQEATHNLGEYGSTNRTLFFEAAEGINNVVFLKEIQYTHGSSGYMSFRTEPKFAWNAPNLSTTVSVQNGNSTITGAGRLCLFFPNASDNGSYGSISVKKVLAYCY